MPAEIYNLAHVLLKRTAGACLFVPIRSIQFLAVLDHEEFIFVDREGRRMIELAWKNFAPQTRQSLDEPVMYEAVFYSPAGVELMRRLQGEFHNALRELEQKSLPAGRARVVPLKGHGQ